MAAQYRCSNCGSELSIATEQLPSDPFPVPAFAHLSAGAEASCQAHSTTPWQPVYQLRDKLIRRTKSLLP